MIDLTTARASIDGETGRSLDLLRRVEDWSGPTRLEGWTIGDLAQHLVFGQALQADAWRRLAAGDPSVAAADEPTVDDRGALLAALVAASADLGEALGAVTDEQVASATCTLPYGTLPAPFVLLIATLEAGVHRSDLSAAAGEDDTLDATTVEAATAVLAGSLPMLAGAGDGSAPAGTSVVLRAPGIELAALRVGDGWTVGEAPAEPTTTIEGTASDVLLFALGRCPASALEVTGDPVGAERFKAWFPGP